MPFVSFVGAAAIQGRALAACATAAEQAAEDLVGKAQDATPVDTGTLQGSIHVEGVSVNGTGVAARVATGGESSEYAVFVHEGHMIPNSPRYVAPVKFLEGPLLANADTYRGFLERASRAAF